MPTAKQLKEYRLELTGLIPWVSILKRPRAQCTGYRDRPMKARFGPQAEALKEKYRCKNKGKFRFRGLKREGGGIDGTYCEQHLRTRGIFYSMEEDERFRNWCEKNIDMLNPIRVKYGLEPMLQERRLADGNRRRA